MGEPVKVYAWTEGDYSDYRVNCLFTSRKDAVAAAGNEDRVEEFWLFDRPIEKRVVYNRLCWVRKDGAEVVNEMAWDAPEPEYNVDARGEISTARTVELRNVWGVEVRGTDKEKVEKAYHDRVAKAKAEVLGL